jgi:alcohol dehydrogenase class IV
LAPVRATFHRHHAGTQSAGALRAELVVTLMTPNLTASIDAKMRQLAEATGTGPPTMDAVRRLAQEFEAMLRSADASRELRRSMLDDEETEGLGSGALMDTGDVENGPPRSARVVDSG